MLLPGSNPDQTREMPAESAGSRDTRPASGIRFSKLEVGSDKVENGVYEQSVVHRLSSSNKVSLLDIARERVDVVSERMYLLPDEYLEEIKGSLRVMLEGNGGSLQRDEFMVLQRLVQSRSDLTADALIRAHRVQLEVLVALSMGIQAFLHPSVSLSQTSLIEIFTYKRCRNIACQSQLPAEECICEICNNRRGFCNLCMCLICHKFDFEVNTCRWIGCDSCSHWTHTDCAIRDKQIGMGHSAIGGTGSAEMLFRCRACNQTSELLGWVKDVFQHCTPTWDRESLLRELDFVSRIFHGSEDTKGRRLFMKCKELIDRLREGVGEATTCKVILMFFQELEMDSSKKFEAQNSGRMIPAQEACGQISEVVQEAVRKLEMVAEEKLRMLKKAQLAYESCDQELEEKKKEAAELKLERQQKRQQIDDLESIVRLKEAEADMFQTKADEARREAERIQRIALSKYEKSEEEYACRYLKLRLSEAEAERQYLFEKMKLQDNPRSTKSNNSIEDPTQVLLSKVQEILKNV